jgi:predicted nuclease of restriction endonuclease-like (RecB) superfamily
LAWSHYVRLLSVQDPDARRFYETQTLRAGWSVRQLDRQIASQFYERSKAARRHFGAKAQPHDELTADEHIRDPFVLEFLGLKDEYSESQLEETLIVHLERFSPRTGRRFRIRGAPETAAGRRPVGIVLTFCSSIAGFAA